MMKQLQINEVVQKGILHEVNRQFFHPLGLSLAMFNCNPESSENAEFVILDARDPEFTFANPNLDKIRSFNEFRDIRMKSRFEAYGYYIQPTEEDDAV